ncbi:MAG: RNHCP domain-containing protein [Ruminococcaceae bacterium]|nr:RNHCP domain-containing protein [Oscillospiraceae bacterium]
MEQKRFTKNDSGFVCAHCGKKVEPLGYTSRNHCPFCLWSLHLDINPGDRASDCGGQLRPIKVETDPKKGFIIVHKCEKCGEIRRNRAATDAKIQPDDIDLIIKLTAAEI